jgi:pyridoxal 5'-phosphate synthase pdxT subunit
VIPGGESTTMQILLERARLFDTLRGWIEAGLPTLGTCAGTILMASRISDGRTDQRGLGVLDIGVRRNGYGRQIDSFQVPLKIQGLNGGPFPGVFIRSPVIEDPGRARVLARYQERPVAVRQGAILGLCFHPELSHDLRLHHEFLGLTRPGDGDGKK